MCWSGAECRVVGKCEERRTQREARGLRGCAGLYWQHGCSEDCSHYSYTPQSPLRGHGGWLPGCCSRCIFVPFLWSSGTVGLSRSPFQFFSRSQYCSWPLSPPQVSFCQSSPLPPDGCHKPGDSVELRREEGPRASDFPVSWTNPRIWASPSLE